MQTIYNFDFAVLNALQSIHNTFFNYFFAFFTFLGDGGIIWIVLTLVMLFIKKTRRAGITMSAGLITEFVINECFVKNLVKRPRPFTLHPYIDTIVSQPSSYSFPSGHTCTAFVSATVIFCYNKKLGVIAYITAALIGISRNYFYIHYPTDVLVGAVEGILTGLLAVLVVKVFCDQTDKKNTTEEKD